MTRIEANGTDNDSVRDITPIFLLSLPRSGSTLTQRVLATHPEIDTASEPWILLPLLYSLRPHGVYAEYGHKLAATAIEAYANGLPGGRDTYLQEIRHHVLRLYGLRAKPGANYFVDKSPRYHLVAEEIIQMFSSGKFIFLWRNPLAIVASMMETWAKGRWNLYEYEVDLFDGLASLIDAQTRHADKAIAVRYEDLVSGDKSEWEKLFLYLGFELDEKQIFGFQGVELDGRMGDPTGRHAYTSLSAEPIEKWKRVLANPLRKRWCRRYLNWIGRARLARMGYDIDQLFEELDSLPLTGRYLLSDFLLASYGVLARIFEPWLAYDKRQRAKAGKRLHAHT
jgi:hypothetical protein